MARALYDTAVSRRYTVVSQGLKAPSSNWSDIRCPFCKATVRAYHWSLYGGGKKCSCGAKHDGYGNTSPIIKASGKA
jgi:hypothetical protein